MIVLEYFVGEEPVINNIENKYEVFKSWIGGWIEQIQLPIEGTDSPVYALMDEEGKLKDKYPNRYLKDSDGEIFDVIAGDFLVVGLGDDGDFVSLTNKDILKVKEYFDLETEMVL